MTASMHEMLKLVQNTLLRPEQPASAFVRIIETGIPEELSGKYVEWDSIPGVILK
jgi:hypothetical protein